MSRTLATMVTMTTYGTWLRGDRRNWTDRHGSERPPNPSLEAADRARLRHTPFLFERSQLLTVADMIAVSLVERLSLSVLAITVQTNHCHFVIGSTQLSIGEVVKRAKESVRWGLNPGRPIWGAGYDKRFCFDNIEVRNRVFYVQRHDAQDEINVAWRCAPSEQSGGKWRTDVETYLTCMK